MSPWLSWEYAEPERDQADLRAFCCTPSKERSTTHPGRFVYPRPPERRAERLIHELNLRKAERMGQRVWVGRDEEGIAAVVSWKWVERDVAHVHVVALALRARGHRGRFSDEMVDTAQAQVAGEAAERGLKEASVTAHIHMDNRASRAFAARFDMDRLSEHDDDGYALYGVTLVFAEV